VASKIPAIPPNHALIGTWITDGEDSDVAFTFSAKSNRFLVSGFCRSDGEKFEINEVQWDGEVLSFTARMPSTDTVTKNVFRPRRDGKIDLELTTYEIWKKKEVKPGRMPEAWRASPGAAKFHNHVRRLRDA
jgi:hypothetical protein